MAKGPIITAKVRQLIAEVYLQYPKWRAKEIRKEVSKRLVNENPISRPDWPGLSIIQKELVSIRRRNNEMAAESQGLDGPWGTSNLAEYPISPEALPSVLQVWVYVRENMNKPFTIREAQWAGRLYATAKDIATLAKFALRHALNERIMFISGNTLGICYEENLDIFSHITEQEITCERESKIYGVIENDWLGWLRLMVTLNKYGIKEMLLEGYTREEVKQKFEETYQNERVNTVKG